MPKLHDNQLTRWRQQKLAVGQRREIDCLLVHLPILRQLTQEILEMLAASRKRTIDCIIKQDEFDLGLEWLLKMTENEPPTDDKNNLHSIQIFADYSE